MLLLTACTATPSDNQKQQQAYDQAQRADAEFQAAQNRAPTAKTLYSMARILAAQRRDTECLTVLNKIIHDYPEFLPAYNELAELQIRQRQVDQAVATLTTALKLSPRSPVVHNNLGMCALLKGDYQGALEAFTRAAARAPEDARYRANMAMALGMMGRYDESLALYQQITTPADAHYNLAVLAEARRDQARADAEYAQSKAAQMASKDAPHKDHDARAPGKTPVE